MTDARQFLKQQNIFFNVRTNAFQGDLQGLFYLSNINYSFASKLSLLEQKRQLLPITFNTNQLRPTLGRLIGKGGYGEVYYGK